MASRIALLAAATLLSGCDLADNYNAPRKVCVDYTQERTSRGMILPTCVRHELQCLKPLSLSTKPNGELACTLNQTETRR